MRIKLSGIYIIRNKKSNQFYIGLSNDIFGRWSSHYTHLLIQKHSSKKFQTLFNSGNITDWTFEILEIVNEKDFRDGKDFKRGEFKPSFKKYMTERERFWMGLYDKSMCLNSDDKFFRQF